MSFTCPSDFGTVYTPAEITAVVDIARARGLKAHLDGARLANAIASLHCSPAAITHEAGIDVFSLGAIKGGAMSTDAIVSFDPEVSEQLHYRVKRAGHVSSKMRFQSVQLIEYLRDGHLGEDGRARPMPPRPSWPAGCASAACRCVAEPQANIIFAKLGDKPATGSGRPRRVLLRDGWRRGALRHQLADHPARDRRGAHPRGPSTQRSANCTAQRSSTKGPISDCTTAWCAGWSRYVTKSSVLAKRATTAKSKLVAATWRSGPQW